MFSTILASTAATFKAPASLPAFLKKNWVADFTKLVLADISAGRSGAQRHTLSAYSVVYRLDVLIEVLERAILDRALLVEVLETAQVWLSFDADKVNAEAAKMRSLRRNVAVSYDAPTPKDANVPAQIESDWRADLVSAITSDIAHEHIGARVHVFSSGYSIRYRLDLSPSILSSVDLDPESLYGLTVKDIVGYAKVWLCFNTEEMVVAPTPSAPDSPLMEPVSPALSDITVVGEPEEYFSKAKVMELPLVESQPFCEPEVCEIALKTSKNGLFEHFFGTSDAPSARFPVLATPASPAAPIALSAASPTNAPVSPRKINLYTHFFGPIETTASRRSDSFFPIVALPKADPITTSYTRVFASLHPSGVPRRRKAVFSSTD